MKKKESTNGSIPPIPEIPSLPVLPETSVKPADKRLNEKAGDDRILDNTKTLREQMTKQDWADRNAGISIDAIHKSMLEGTTLAQLTLGHSYPEVEEITEKYLRFNLKLNRTLKAE